MTAAATGTPSACHVLAAAGWDVDAEGLFGAPEITVVVSEERHATVDRALRLLGFGQRRITAVAADDQGRMRPAALRDALGDRPAIVCAQAGNVNTGAFDPFREICGIAHQHDAWVHVDGAFGLWAATPSQPPSGDDAICGPKARVEPAPWAASRAGTRCG